MPTCRPPKRRDQRSILPLDEHRSTERFNRTMVEEWAYARPYRSESDRAALFNDWLHTYNHHRGHTALKGKSPADLVPNLRGQNN